MEKEKVLFVYNPRAGKGTLRNKLADIIDMMMKRQWDVSIAATQKAGDAVEYIIQKGIGCDRVICSGGDGTLHEVIHGLMTLPPDMRPACGYIPTGTVNDFANSIRLPKRVIPCAQIAVGDKKSAYDVGDMNGNFFSYVAAFGAFTSVSYETPQATKNLFGKTAYILDGAVKLGKTKSYHIKVQTDLETWEQDCILGMVTNAKSVAGLKLYKKSSVIARSYDLFINIDDRAGAIATIATILSVNGISIKNIGIIHNREYVDGVMKLELYKEDDEKKARELLIQNRYDIVDRD